MAVMKLTPDMVLTIRRAALEGVLNVREAARFYNVGPETIRRAVRGETYWNVATPTVTIEDSKKRMRIHQFEMMEEMGIEITEEQKETEEYKIMKEEREIKRQSADAALLELAKTPQYIVDKANELLGRK